ncbi:MAG: class I tRNA ligase family protein, partial [Candidatus Pacearchaeota archaeon]
RYLHLKNKNAISPIYNKEIPIIPHPIASIEKGSGLVMMCSAGDLSDIQFFRELKIKPTIAINKDGRMNSNAGFLEGLKVREAREKIINELKNRNLIQKQEEIMHKTPISERSGTEIEFIEMSEFYLKQIEIKNKIKSIARKIKFYPPESRRILYSWIDSISIDWPISRRRFYATPIPLWYCREKNLVVIPPEGRYYQPWKESPPKDAEVYRNGKKIGKVNDFNENWIGEERVFDTWFDSSISELFILGYKRNNEFFNKSYPATLRPQGKEIVRTWLYYTLLRGYLETKKPCFRDVWIHQHILDERGRKMSKSLGNVINPQEIIREIGAECFRLWIAEEGDLSKQDLSCSKEKIRSMRKSINKLINVSRFIMQFKKPEKPKKIEKIDELFIACIEDLTLYCDKCYEKYDFYHPAIKLREFLWETFASHYIELIKSRAYNEENKFSEEESNSARYSLHFILERYLHLVYPIIPQVSSVIAFEKGINLLKADFPKPIKHKVNTKKIEKIIEFNKKVWKAKKESGISLRSAIKNIKIPRGLEEYEKDIRMCHNL